MTPNVQTTTTQKIRAATVWGVVLLVVTLAAFGVATAPSAGAETLIGAMSTTTYTCPEGTNGSPTAENPLCSVLVVVVGTDRVCSTSQITISPTECRAIASTFIIRPAGAPCPVGFALDPAVGALANGSRYCFPVEAPTTCPDGYGQVDGKCIRYEAGTSPAIATTSYSCPNGTSGTPTAEDPICTLDVPVEVVWCAGHVVTVDIANGEVPTAGNDVILGTSGNDVIDALAGDDIVCALGGRDIVSGGPGRDWIYGGSGRDLLVGGDERDKLFGQGGADRLVGERSRDILRGGAGNDILVGGGGNDSLRGGGGRDTLQGDRGRDVCNGNGGTDNAQRCEVLVNIP